MQANSKCYLCAWYFPVVVQLSLLTYNGSINANRFTKVLMEQIFLAYVAGALLVS